MLILSHDQRTDFMLRTAQPFLQGPRVLDVGSGRCRLEQRLAQTLPGLDVTSTDLQIKPNRDGYRPRFVAADGACLPFAARAFETAHLGFMLHHVPDPLRILREVARVTAGRILIWEDTPEPGMERALVEFSDSLLNRDFGRNPHQNRRHADWLREFERLGLRLLHEQRSWMLVFGVPMVSSFFALELPEGHRRPAP